jgi:predicted CxxxxCH...CXXCH cytochrome family protein
MGTQGRSTPQSCDNAGCHNPSNEGYAATWGTAINDCTSCHGDDGTTAVVGTGDHSKHLAQSGGGALFGVTINCGQCHVGGQAVNHTDGSVDFIAPFDVQYAQATGCGTNVCHEDGAGGAPKTPSYAWDSVGNLADCTICHLNGPATGGHATHLGYGDAVCGNCHTAETAGTHIGGSVTTANVNLDGPKTCTTTSCHNQGADRSVAWTPSGTPLACNDCHGDASGGLSGAHATHVAVKACSDCHVVPTDTTHISTRPANIVTSAVASTGEATVGFADVDFAWADPGCTYTAGNGVPGCHATGSPADWAGGAPACTDCHTDTTTAAVNPTSGLHGTTAGNMISGNPHDGSFASTAGGADDSSCDACHTTAPSATHQDATLDTPTVWDAVVSFTSGTNSCDSSCHIDAPANRNGALVTQAWERLWSTTSGARTVTVRSSPARASGPARCT